MCSITWKARHPKGRQYRPGISEIMAFLPEDVGALFQAFSRQMSRAYDVGCKPPVYTETNGWVYHFGRYNIHLLCVSMDDGAFVVQGVRVCDEASYQQALAVAESRYDDYKIRFDRNVAAKKEKQKQNTQNRKAREQSELEALAAAINPARFNKYRWSPKLSRQILKRLYDKDAMGIKDEELANEVGYALYTRCLQGRDEGRLKDTD